MANEPGFDPSLDTATLEAGITNGTLGQILAQLKIISFLLREGLTVNSIDDDLGLLAPTPFTLNNPPAN